MIFSHNIPIIKAKDLKKEPAPKPSPPTRRGALNNIYSAKVGRIIKKKRR
tara:strand:- start:2394 stop:2543 length:150 start_codon:yes stop_codon:yes gene_type:complete